MDLDFHGAVDAAVSIGLCSEELFIFLETKIEINHGERGRSRSVVEGLVRDVRVVHVTGFGSQDTTRDVGQASNYIAFFLPVKRETMPIQ